MVRQLRVMLLFGMFTSSWAMDVNMVAQMAEFSQYLLDVGTGV